jgi:hypothetical protein
MNTPKTIEIFLSEGKPTGVKAVELSNWTGKAYVIPRNSLNTALENEELTSQAVYFLIGQGEDGQRLYIGESENFAQRVKNHHQTKDFWETAICFFSKDDNLNKAHVKYLESILTKEAKLAVRAELASGKSSNPAKLSASDEAFAKNFAKNIKLVLSGLGYTFLKQATEDEPDQRAYVCAGDNFKAHGTPTSEGFVVLAGSTIRKRETDSIGPNTKRQRDEFAESGIFEDVDDKSYELTKDVVFNSPSQAGSVVSGRQVNGWTVWKTEDGRTLDEVERQEI